MKEAISCPNCQTELKSGLLSSVKFIRDEQAQIINEYHEPKSDSYCNKCGESLFGKYRTKMMSEKDSLQKEFRRLVSQIPVVTTHHPLHWDYSILGMVTAQSTTGTGVITEFTSTFSDVFGSQSNRHNSKLKAGEDLCFAQLRRQAFDMGGNAVVATDIDYSEVGSGRGMLMVCMAGTVVKLDNLEVLGKDKSDDIKNIIEVKGRMDHLNSFSIETQYG